MANSTQVTGTVTSLQPTDSLIIKRGPELKSIKFADYSTSVGNTFKSIISNVKPGDGDFGDALLAPGIKRIGAITIPSDGTYLVCGCWSLSAPKMPGWGPVPEEDTFISMSFSWYNSSGTRIDGTTPVGTVFQPIAFPGATDNVVSGSHMCTIDLKAGHVLSMLFDNPGAGTRAAMFIAADKCGTHLCAVRLF